MNTYKVNVCNESHTFMIEAHILILIILRNLSFSKMAVLNQICPGRKTPLPDHIIRNYMYQLCKSLQHMHR